MMKLVTHGHGDVMMMMMMMIIIIVGIFIITGCYISFYYHLPIRASNIKGQVNYKKINE